MIKNTLLRVRTYESGAKAMCNNILQRLLDGYMNYSQLCWTISWKYILNFKTFLLYTLTFPLCCFCFVVFHLGGSLYHFFHVRGFRLAILALKEDSGVPVVAQQKRTQLGTIKLRVWFLALLSGLSIWHCGELWCRWQTWLGSGVAVAVV